MTSPIQGELLQSLANLPPTKYACAAGTVVCFYDFILTFPQEVRYVWGTKDKLTTGKAMFLWNRYSVLGWLVLSNYHIAGFRGPLTDRFCKVTIVGVGIAQGVSIMIGVQLLSLRVLALYKNDRRLRAGLIVWLTLCHGALWAMALESIIRFYPSIMFLPGTNTCYAAADTVSQLIYIPPLLAETALVILQATKHLQTRSLHKTFNSPLMITLYRDGYIYFATIMTIRLVCLFMFTIAPPSLRLVSNQLDFSLTTTLISRFFLQLRAAVLRPERHDESAIETSAPTSYNLSTDFRMMARSRTRQGFP